MNDMFDKAAEWRWEGKGRCDGDGCRDVGLGARAARGVNWPSMAKAASPVRFPAVASRAAVVEEAFAVLADGKPRLLSFGVTDEMAWEVGLACGGRVEIFVERVE